ncbi:MAG TPA: hypothetical protein VLV16_02120 [Gemmatimonadales bacterium]|nr:hypothetical protein [Gemmatimonadales bacterium]
MDHLKERAGRHDRDALVLLQGEQVIVPGYDDRGPALDGGGARRRLP